MLWVDVTVNILILAYIFKFTYTHTSHIFDLTSLIASIYILILFHFRCKDLDKKGILYVGSGVSGGEEGARYGPSLMPGGNAAAWPYIKDIFQVKPIRILHLF